MTLNFYVYGEGVEVTSPEVDDDFTDLADSEVQKLQDIYLGSVALARAAVNAPVDGSLFVKIPTATMSTTDDVVEHFETLVSFFDEARNTLDSLH